MAIAAITEAGRASGITAVVTTRIGAVIGTVSGIAVVVTIRIGIVIGPASAIVTAVMTGRASVIRAVAGVWSVTPKALVTGCAGPIPGVACA